jgi:hypothetical protein
LRFYNKRLAGKLHPRKLGNRSESDIVSSIVAVGFCTKDDKLTGMPGWDSSSWGYHGDDGGLFHGSAYSAQCYGVEFGTKDVVGCGFNAGENTIFFTINGRLLGE